tara:strand:+ start:531 stop:1802 length:1272 start_codon:yes stop_codon:yes gene_type:complete
MKDDVILKAENLSKQYRLGTVGTGTISHDLNRWWAVIRGKEDPYLKVGESNDRSSKGNSEYVWALKDISFEVKRGEVLGIIGKNGAGKSTLLKILSKVTGPTTGNIKSKGRIASLLEVGTGFHPEMTGRENIFLNGAILGMTKKEIRSKLEEIVTFSGCERYIDTPVKRYSSGMKVRLAFAVAAHLEPDILVIDEVLAVGDVEFQKKAIGKIQDISKGQGRTVLFVSHNMRAVQQLCTDTILLKNGSFVMKGKTDDVIKFYLEQSNNTNKAEYLFDKPKSEDIAAYSTKLRIENLEGKLLSEVPIGQPWKIKLYFSITKNIKNFIAAVGMTDLKDTAIRTSWSSPVEISPGNYIAEFSEKFIHFNSGQYKLIIGLSSGTKNIQYLDEDIFVLMSDIVHSQEDSVINNASGILNNQMEVYVHKI